MAVSAWAKFSGKTAGTGFQKSPLGADAAMDGPVDDRSPEAEATVEAGERSDDAPARSAARTTVVSATKRGMSAPVL
jgi:hypothetical protein